METTKLFILAMVVVSGVLSKRSKTGLTNKWLSEPIASINDSTVNSRKLVEYTKREFGEKKVHQVADNIYVAIGYALGNSIMIVGDDGVILIDVTESADAMVEIMREFRVLSEGKPVKAILFTHFHTAETYDIGSRRANRMFGSYLPFNPVNNTGSGLGPFLRVDKTTQLIIPVPTITYNDTADFTVAGVDFTLIHVPGETDDQTALWYPEKKALFIGDDFYKTFPNLYTIRGSPARNSRVWYESLDRVIALNAKYLVGSHCTWIEGEGEVHDNLVLYRDAIKFVHDQTLRYTNKGYFPNQITELVELPPELANSTYLQEHYGFVPWCVKGVFTNYLGWFSGDPKDLNPMSESARAKNLISLVRYAMTHKGDPRRIILRHAQISHIKSDKHYRNTGKHLLDNDKWAIEIVDLLLAENEINRRLRKAANVIKTSALTAIGVEEISPNGRNYYLTYASEIYDGLDVDRTEEVRATELKGSPIERVLGIQCSKVDGLECAGDEYSIRLSFTDKGKNFTMRLRHCVCDVLTDVPSNPPPDVHVRTTTTTYQEIAAGERDLDKEVKEGNVDILVGTLQQYQEFLSCFDSLLTL